MADWRNRLAQLGLALPKVATPLAAYVPARLHGDLIFVSGQLPLQEGSLLLEGALGPGADLALAQAAMRQCFLNGLAAAVAVAGQREIEQVVRLGGFVASQANFYDHHLVTNGASDLARELFGDAGVHARAAVGVAALPVNAAVELEILFGLA